MRNVAIVLVLVVGGYLMAFDLGLLDRSKNASPVAETRQCADFTIYVNGIAYQQSYVLAPEFPIMVDFCHPSGAFTRVVMRHPGDPSKRMFFDANGQHRIHNHEQHMRAGHDSTSEFIALDAEDIVLGHMALTFRPHAQ